MEISEIKRRLDEMNISEVRYRLCDFVSCLSPGEQQEFFGKATYRGYQNFKGFDENGLEIDDE